ncbi:MAG: hypothetical protein IPJ65_19710 [Archangiaceae bacterium]|nr:hypothetical protein [Archangiaceae bacterium]
MMVLDGEQRGVRARLEADSVEPDFRALLVVATAHARAHAGAWVVVTPEGVDARPVIKTLKENGFPAKLEVVRLAEPSDDAQKR